jgi:hypothetical protein
MSSQNVPGVRPSGGVHLDRARYREVGRGSDEEGKESVSALKLVGPP